MSAEIFLPKVELSTYEPSKFNNELIKTTIVEHFKETGDSPLETLVRMDAIAQLFDGVRGELRDMVVDELAKYPGGKAEILGSEISKIESGVKYIYDQDYNWTKLNNEVESLKYALKEREKMLRMITSPMVDPETGEMVHPAPKISTTTFKISLKK
jgi:hypothetical protein